MLHEFLAAHRDELIQRCQQKLAARVPHGAHLQNWVPRFIDQLIEALQSELALCGTGTDPVAIHPDIGMAAALYGKEMLAQGYAVHDVVHNYGDICQSISDLAVESGDPFTAREFRILNRSLDNAIAHAVSEFSYQRDFISADKHANDANERMEIFSDELRNLVGTATLAFSAMKSGGLNASGATGTILERCLLNVHRLVDSVSVQFGGLQRISDVLDVFPLAPFLDEVYATAAPVARALGCTLTLQPVDRTLALKGNRDLMYAALIGLLQNAFEFTQHKTDVVLSAHAAAERILIDIADHCGGLGAGGAATMLGSSASRSMLGIPAARRFVASCDGVLLVRDVPGLGCVVTVSLPRYAVPT